MNFRRVVFITVFALLNTGWIFAQELGNPLFIPPLLKDQNPKSNEASFKLKVQEGETQFFRGITNSTLGYNGNLLGPTIRIKKNQRVRIDVENLLNEYTTTHWHGLLVPGYADGGPHQVINPDSKWSAEFTVRQPAATAWYHPHGLGNTATQVYFGLAGMIIIDDENSESLNIPKVYGENDFPLIVQDRRFSRGGRLAYNTSMNDQMAGMTGNTIIVNGVVNSFLKVDQEKIRFRILNGSNARLFNFKLSNGRSFFQIASDGGFLEAPLKMRKLKLSPGERAEIIVDFSEYKKGSKIRLESGNFEIIKFIVGGASKQLASPLPKKLATIEDIPKKQVSEFRDFVLSGMGHMVSINGLQYNPNRINERVDFRATEIWEVTSNTNMMGGMMMGSSNSDIYHNFHIHAVQFQILSRDGKKPPKNERGWKDTFVMEENERVRIIMRFLHKGVFMYHCHILEHEDNGMMGQFRVQ